MQREPSPDSTSSDQRLWMVWTAWGVLLGIILVRGWIWPHKNNCFLQHYRPAGLNWLAGKDLYQATADTCRYSPLIHALLVPFSILPERPGSTFWRIIESIAFLAALRWWLLEVCPAMLSVKQRGWILGLSMLLALGSLNNGQSNVFVMAAMLAGIAAAAKQRWAIAAGAIAFACYFKIYPIALGLVLTALFPRRFGLRFMVALVAGALLPFALQTPGYVAHQYARWFENLIQDDRSHWLATEAYRDAWLLIRQFDLSITIGSYRVLQLVAGLMVGLLCILVRYRGGSRRDMLNICLGLTACWMTVFGPATESSTYILLSATLAWLLVASWSAMLPDWTRVTVTLSATLFVVTVIAVSTPHGRAILAMGTQPLAGVLIMTTLGAVSLGASAPRGVERAEPAQG